jgi:hypothetical protein
MAKLKKMAKLFDRNVNELTELMGYTRQGIHLIFEGKIGIDRERLAQMIERLDEEDARLFLLDCEKANEKSRERIRFINELKAMLTGDNLSPTEAKKVE